MSSRLRRAPQDLRVAWRFLRKRPLSTGVAALTLGIAVAVCSLAVSLVDQAFWRDATGRDGSPLVTIYNARAAAPQFQVLSWRDVETLRGQLRGRVDLAAFVRIPATVGTGAEPARLIGEIVSDNYFSVLGAIPARGRLLDADSGDRAIVISETLWRTRLGSAEEVVGRSLRVGRDEYVVAGVTPAGFRDPAYDAQFWLTAGAARRVFGQDLLPRPDVPLFQTVGRREEAATLAQIQGRLNGLETYASKDGWRLAVLPGSYLRFWPAYRDAVGRFLRVFVALGICVLLIAAANLGGLLLARGGERSRELALRQALGASPADLVARLAAECVILTAGGGAIGLVLAAWAASLFPRVPVPVPAPLTLTFDLRAAAIAVGVSLVAATVFTTLSVMRGLRSDPQRVLAGSSQALSPPSLAPRLLVVAQVAIGCVLLVLGGLLTRSAVAVGRIDAGFSTRNQSVGLVDLRDQTGDAAEIPRFYERLQAALERRPEVESVAIAWHVPLTPMRVTGTYTLGAGTSFQARQNVVSPGYFETLGIPLLQGRAFGVQDGAGGDAVAIVNETLAARYAGGAAIGEWLRDGRRTFRIVGVVRDLTYNGLTEPAQPYVYYPFAQSPRPDMYVHVRTRVPGSGDTIRAAVHDLDPRVAVSDISSFAAIRDEAEAVPRTSARAAVAAAALAALLATLGLYGVLTSTVHRRRRELAIRAALGATPAAVVREVVVAGAGLALPGIAIGCALSVPAGRLVDALLFGVTRHDPVVYGFVPLLVCAVSAVALFAPARQASRVDPVSVLRSE